MVTLEDAERLRIRLDEAPIEAPVTVVGAGITGLETAAELAERGRRVTLVCGDVLGSYLHPRARRAVAKRLAKLGVQLIEGSGAKVAAVRSDAVQLADGHDFASTVTVWAAGFGVPELAMRSGLSTDSVGRLITDETLTSVDDERIVAAGDSAAPSDLPYRMSAYSAQPLGAHAADTVLRRIAGEEPQILSLGFFGVCVGLGRHHATLQLARKDDQATSVTASGRLPALMFKEGGTRGVRYRLVHEARKPGSFSSTRDDPTRQERVRSRRAEVTET